jgi:hypothetical protein
MKVRARSSGTYRSAFVAIGVPSSGRCSMG